MSVFTGPVQIAALLFGGQDTCFLVDKMRDLTIQKKSHILSCVYSKNMEGKEYMPLRFREESVGARLSGWVWKVVPEFQL